MAIELEDGTIVRSLPEQVDYLTTHNEENEIAIDNLAARLEAAIAGVLHYKGSVATYADLPADAEIGDVYNVIDTGANYAWTGSEWDELGSSIDISSLVDLTSAQTITGIKTFSTKIQLGDSSNSVGVNSNELELKSGIQIRVYNNIRPSSGGNYSLGSRTLPFKEISLSHAINPNASNYGLTFPDTSGFTADKEIATKDQALNVLNASDFPTATTLSDDQYNIIMNGKPTLVIGTIVGLTNPIILYAKDLYGNGYGTILGGGASSNKTLTSIAFSGTNHAIALLENQYANFHIKGVTNFNGKNIPSYPSSTGTFVLKCVDGVLTWVQE